MKEFFLVIAFLISTLLVVFLIIAIGWFLVWSLLVRRFRLLREIFMIKDSPNTDCHGPFRLQPSCKPGAQSGPNHQPQHVRQSSNGFTSGSNDKSVSFSLNSKTTSNSSSGSISSNSKKLIRQKEEEDKENLISIRERQHSSITSLPSAATTAAAHHSSSSTASSSFQSNVKGGSIVHNNNGKPLPTIKLHMD